MRVPVVMDAEAQPAGASPRRAMDVGLLPLQAAAAGARSLLPLGARGASTRRRLQVRHA